MARRPISLLIAFIAWSILLIVLLVNGDDPPAVRSAERPPARADAGDPSRTRLETPEAASAERTVQTPPDREGRPALRVLVVERASGLPIAGAEVRAASTSDLVMHDEHRPQWHPEEDDLLDAVGTKAVTNEHGEAWVSPGSPPAIVDARFRDQWGSTRIEKDSAEPIRIELDVDRDLAIQVVDGAGKPVAGVPVVVRAGPGQGPRDEAWNDVTRAPDGIARLPHVDRKLARLRAKHPCAQIAILGRDLAFVPFELDALPAEPIRLVLPPTGSVEITLVDDSGKAVLARMIQLMEGTSVDTQGFPLQTTGPQLTPVRIDEGRVRYAHVGLDLDLVAFAFAPGYEPAGVHAVGPRQAGELVVIDIPFGTGHPVMVLRLVDEQRMPLADRMVQMSVGSRSRGSIHQPIKSDARGIVRLPTLAPADDHVSTMVDLLVDSPGPCQGCQASLAVPSELHGSENDLGDLVLRPPPFLCSGSVVDDVGQGIPNAWIGSEIERDEAGKMVWIARAGVRCDAQGTFILQADAPTTKMRVRAQADEHARADPIEVAPGARDVRLVLDRGCELSGSLVLDKSVPLGDVKILVRRPGAPKFSSPDFDKHDLGIVHDDGGFALDSLRSGLVDVQVLWMPMREELALIERIDLAPGALARDPRLDRIDLSDVRLLHVEVVDAAGAVVETGAVSARSGTRAARSYPLKSGAALVLAWGPATDLEIRARGLRVARERSVAADIRVVLSRGLGVRIHVPAGVRLPEPPLYLGLQLDLAGKDPTGAEDMNGWFDVDSELALVLPEPGLHELRWVLRKDLDRGSHLQPLANASVTRFEVFESSGEQSFTAAPDPSELADALRALDRMR